MVPKAVHAIWKEGPRWSIGVQEKQNFYLKIYSLKFLFFLHHLQMYGIVTLKMKYIHIVCSKFFTDSLDNQTS